MEAQSLAVVRVPGKFTSRTRGGDHLGRGNSAIDRRLLPGNFAGLQALQTVQRYPQQDAHRRRRSARFHGSVLPHRDHMHSVVHVRDYSAHHMLSKSAELFPRRDEHHRHNGHHSLLYHLGHGSCRRGGDQGRHRAASARAK